MNLLFIALLLISFVFQTYEYYFLAIPVRLLIHHNGSKTYDCLDKKFHSKKDLKQTVKKLFSQIPPNFLLIHLISISYGIMVNASHFNNRYIKVNSNDNFEDINVGNTDYFIETSGSGKNLMYTSNDGYYSTYKQASENLDNVKKYDKVKSQIRLVGKDVYGQETWRSIWNNCYYKCFSKMNFFYLATRLLEELNKYRKHFLLNPVKFSNTLYPYACFAAKSIAGSNVRLIHRVVSMISNEIVVSTSAPFASVKMNQWYEHFLLSKRKPSKNTQTTKIVNALFSKRTTEVGFGAAQKGKLVVIVIMYK